MNQTLKTILYIVGGLLLVALMVGVVTQLDPPTNWRKTYSPQVTEPFGSKLIFERMEDLFTKKPKLITKTPFYQTVYEPRQDIAYFFHKDHISIYQELTIQELEDFVSRGNDLFFSTHDLSPQLLEWLGIDFMFFKPNAKADSTYISTSTQDTLCYPIYLEDIISYISVDEYDPPTILATIQNGAFEQPCFVKISMGKGHIYVSCVPDILSNYYLLNTQTRPLISYLLTQIPEDRQIWWDQYKGLDNLGGGGSNDSELGWLSLFKYLNEFPAFRWALWILIIGSLIYVFFEGKRTQRRVPEIAPLPNSTLDFTQTIGRLYFQVKNNQQLALKRIKILLAFIRSQYNISTNKIDSNFERQLVAKSGVNTADVASLCFKIRALADATLVSDEELRNLTNDIEIFYAQTKYKQIN